MPPPRAPALAALALVTLAQPIACDRGPPPPPPPGQPGDVRFVPPVYTDAAAVVVAVVPYREPGKQLAEDTAVAGTGKTWMIVSERATAAKIGRDVLAAGGTAVDAAVAAAFALAVVHPAATGLGGGGVAVVRTAAGDPIALDFRGTPDAPGFVAGLALLHARHGKQPWPALLAPAIALARDGFVLDRRTATLLAEAQDRLDASPASVAIWKRGGAVHDEGTQLVLPDLAATLEAIATGGPAAFYRGGGPRLAPTAPLRFGYRGHTVATMPAPLAGGALLAIIAGLVHDADLGSVAWHGKDHVHRVVEAWKRAFATGGTLPTKAALAQLAGSITDRAADASTAVPSYDGDLASPLVVVDRTGLAVAITTTLGAPFGTGVTVAGYLQAQPPTANARSLLAPYIVENARGELALLGAAGGAHESITASWQILSNVVDFGHRASLAVNNARFHHQQLPDTLYLEDRAIDQPTEAALVEQGHAVDWNRPARELGIAAAIVRTATGWAAAADTRGGGVALGD